MKKQNKTKQSVGGGEGSSCCELWGQIHGTCWEEVFWKANTAGRLWRKDIFAGYNEVFGTGESAQLFLKLKVFMPQMKPNSAWVRDALKCIKEKKTATPVGKLNKTRVIWGKVSGNHRNCSRVHAKFQSNHPVKATGQRIRVILYPFRISTNEK